MAKQNRSTLKGYFESGKIPNQKQYSDLLDSTILHDNSDQSDVNFNHITASGDVVVSGSIHLNSDGQFHGNNIFFGPIKNTAVVPNISGQPSRLKLDGDDYVLIEAEKEVKIGCSRLLIGEEYDTGLTEDGDLSFPGITLSGSISASGNILLIGGENGHGHISMSGNISASGGTGSFSSLKVDGSSIDFSGLPTSATGLPVGRLYNDSGVVKIKTA